MVRPINVARSRACNQCKKKRIKCDLRRPACQRCIESNLPCSGPFFGLLMINTDSSTFASVPPERPPIIPSALVPQAPAARIVTYYAPSMSSVYEDALLWSFLGAFFPTPAGRVWDAKLPYLRSAKNATAMKAAAKAVSLAFAAHGLKDLAMAASACEYYGQSLRYHQRSFVTANGRKICYKKAVNALPVTVLLSYFEIIQPTSADAWGRHITAAERLFLLMGSNALQDELLNHLYFIVKSNSVIRCFLTGSKTQLFGRPWSSIRANRLRGCSTLLYNSLIELLAHLSDHFATIDSPKNHSMHDELAELSELSIAFGNSIGLEMTGFLWVNSHLEYETIQDPRILTPEPEIPEIASQLRDRDICLTAAYLHAAAVLLLTILRRTNSEDWSQNDISICTSYHSTQILSCAKYLAARGLSCSCLRMMLPIAAVDRYSPVQQHRTLARTMFASWSALNGLQGLCSTAFGENSNDHARMPLIVLA